MQKTAKTIIRYRKTILVITLVITAIFGWFMKDLEVDPDVFNYLPDDDTAAALFNEIGGTYGGNYIAIIGLEAEDVFSRDVLEVVRMMTDSLEMLEGIGSVTSLTNVIDITGSDWGIEISSLIDPWDLPSSRQELDSLRNYTLSQEMYRGTLVSDDATFTAIMVRIAEGTDKIAVARQIRDFAESCNPGYKIYYGGLPFTLLSLADIILGDLILLAPLTALVIILVLFFGFRSWRGVLLPLVTVGFSTIWTMGLMGMLNIRLSIISDVIPVILLAVGSAYTIHVINRIRETPGETPGERITAALSYIITPVLMASVTTMIGFVSFIFGSYLTLISTFGLFTAAGIFFALLLSVTFAPAFLAVFPGRGKDPVFNNEKGHKLQLTAGLLKHTATTVLRHPGRIIAVWSIIIGAGIAGILMIQRNVDMIDYFKKSDPTHVAEEIFRDKFGGSFPVYIEVKGDMQSPIVLKKMDAAAEYIKKHAAVTHTQSVADLIKEMNDLMEEGESIPDEKLKVQQLWILLDGQTIMDQLVNYDLDAGLVSGTFNTGDVKVMDRFVDDLETYLKRESTPECQMQLTGLPSLYLKIDKSIVNSQFQSLAYALVLVLLVVSLLLRSWSSGLYSIIPILATLLVLFGFMGLTAIPLDIATVLVGSVSIGIGVDYAIHMISHLNHELNQHGKLEHAISHATNITGRSIIINVMAVALGFLVLLLSNLVPLQRFGLLVSVTMITSAAAALTLLPAVMLMIHNRRKT
ncbi:MAG: efflux RND transporter permease subunit [Bacteroidales bacterium]|nr:efflux RND transporter permease subunit [Bacteroidales bacterium]